MTQVKEAVNNLKNEKVMKDLHDTLAKLTDKQALYYRIMHSKSGVLFISGPPGVAKSSIAKAIADKLNFQYLDIRLSMVDETDVGLYPVLTKVTLKGTEIPALDFAVPRWAIEANERPTIIHFEELNRASLGVRNAALQILLERGIGTKFKFNDDVLMISSGNLGEEDGTEVEEFDAALNNRLIHLKHDLTTKEWLEDYAMTRIHPMIIEYMKLHPEELFKAPNDNQRCYPTPRSWTFLSDFIVNNYGKDQDQMENWMPILKKVGNSFIGASVVKFIKYCEDSKIFTIDDILNRYDKIEKHLKNAPRDRVSELLQKIKETIKIDTLKPKQMENLIKFLQILNDDEIASFTIKIMEANDFDAIKSTNFNMFAKAFKEKLVDLRDKIK